MDVLRCDGVETDKIVRTLTELTSTDQDQRQCAFKLSNIQKEVNQQMSSEHPVLIKLIKMRCTHTPTRTQVVHIECV